ncbi:unnamed protein product [Lampetra planeri]
MPRGGGGGDDGDDVQDRQRRLRWVGHMQDGGGQFNETGIGDTPRGVGPRGILKDGGGGGDDGDDDQETDMLDLGANRTGVVRGCAPHQCDRPNLFLPSDATLRCCDTDLCNRLSILDVVQGSVNLEVGSQGFSYSDSGNSAPRTAAFGGWSWLGMSALIGLASTFQGV